MKNSDGFRLVDVLVKSSVGRSEVSMLQEYCGVLIHLKKIIYCIHFICVEMEIVMNSQIDKT